MRRAYGVLYLVIALVLLVVPPAAAQGSQTDADALLAEAQARFNAGDYGAALESAEAALAIYRETDDQAGELRALAGLGDVHVALGDHDSARRAWEQALALARQTGDRATEAWTLHSLGSLSKDLFEYEQALDYYEQAIALRHEIGDQDGESDSLNSAAIIHQDLARYDIALDYFERARDIDQALGNRADLATVLDNMGVLFRDTFEYDRALEMHEQALSIRHEVGDLEGKTFTLNNMGALYVELGDHDSARHTLEQALALARQTGDRAAEARARHNLGGVSQARSQYEQALDYYEQAIALRREIGDLAGESTSLNSAAIIYQDLARYDIALNYFERAHDIDRAVGDQAGLATVLNNMAVLYEERLEYDRALELHKQALPIRRQMGDLVGEAATLNNVGHIYYALGDYPAAVETYEAALEIHQDIGDRYGQAITLHNLGEAKKEMLDVESALSYLRRAHDVAQEIGSRDLEAQVLDSLAVLHSMMSQPEEALEYALQAVDVIESMHGELRTESLQAGFAGQWFDEYELAVELLLQLEQPEKAFEVAEQSRARALLTVLGNQPIQVRPGESRALAAREQELREEIVALEAAVRSDSAALGSVERLQSRRRDYEQLLTELQVTSPEYASLVSVDVLTVPEVQALLAQHVPEAVLLSYLVGEYQTTLFVISASALHSQVVQVTRHDLEQQVEALRAQMIAKPMTPDYWQEPAHTLYGWLIAPVRQYLPAPDADHPPRLGIAPHGQLHYLPFALLADDDGQLLIDGYHLFSVPSASSLKFMLDQRAVEDAGPVMLAMAKTDVPGLPRLQNAGEEAKTVARRYRAQPFLDDMASEARVKATAGQHQVVHLAAHSDYVPDAPLFSAIMLSPGENEDGRLEVHEVFNLNLARTRLVVLSACETRLGELSAGDELVSLERAFVRAGASSLVTTLWPVNDPASERLMVEFYRQLDAGHDLAGALRRAQHAVRHEPEYAHPYYWAGFVLVGDPEPSLSKSDTVDYAPWAAGAVVTAAAALLVVAWRLGPSRKE